MNSIFYLIANSTILKFVFVAIQVLFSSLGITQEKEKPTVKHNTYFHQSIEPNFHNSKGIYLVSTENEESLFFEENES